MVMTRLKKLVWPVKRAMASPAKAALLYLALATSSSIVAAYFQGTLLCPRTVFIGSASFVVNPYLYNFSTIIDFVILNPLCMFFLLKSREGARFSFEKKRADPNPAPYHRLGFLLLSATIALVSMKFYVGAFQGAYFDSNFTPDIHGRPQITTAGYIVFFWTALYIAILFWHVLNYARYVLWIMQLKKDDLEYHPFDDDDSGGLFYIASPILHFFNALIVLLVTLIIFTFQDYSLSIKESNRCWGFALFLIVGVPLFVAPILHIKNIMVLKKKDYFNIVATHAKSTMGMKKNNNLTDKKDYSSMLIALETIDKSWAVVAKFPHWPMPRSSFVAPISAFIGAAIPVFIKLADIVIKSYIAGTSP